MGKTTTVIKREYLERTRKRSFLVGTILGPVLIAGLILVPGLLMHSSARNQWRIVVIDQTDQIFPQLAVALDDTLKWGQPVYQLKKLSSSAGQLNSDRQTLNRQVLEGLISGYVIIDSQVFSTGEAEFHAQNVGDYNTIEEIGNALSRIVIGMRLTREGLDPEKITSFTRPVHLKTLKVGKGGERESGFAEMFVETMVFVMMLYMTILLYGVTVMRGVIEEKSSRIVEVLLSSLKPTQLMAGKILGVGLVGLTQYLIWIAFGLSLSAIGATYLGLGKMIRGISADTFLYFLLFYLLGYFLYATLYAGVGAVCSTEQDAQQIQFPIILLLILPLMLAGTIVRNPEGDLATILSLIPFFSPMLMFLRINLVTPPLSQILASISLLVGTIVLMIWLVAKIFRVGLLMYGKRPSVPEIIRWMRTR